MSQPRREYDLEFKAGAVRIVRDARRSISEVARELGIGAGLGELGSARTASSGRGRGPDL